MHHVLLRGFGSIPRGLDCHISHSLCLANGGEAGQRCNYASLSVDRCLTGEALVVGESDRDLDLRVSLPGGRSYANFGREGQPDGVVGRNSAARFVSFELTTHGINPVLPEFHKCLM